MRKVFLILYDAAGKRRLASDADKSPAEERDAFNKIRNSLPADVARAELHDTDLGGRFLVATRPPAGPPPTAAKPAITPSESEEPPLKRKGVVPRPPVPGTAQPSAEAPPNPVPA